MNGTGTLPCLKNVKTRCIEEEVEGAQLHNVNQESCSSSISLLIRTLPEESRPGWPLLQRAKSSAGGGASAEARQMSVVQWALQLPDRSSPHSSLGSEGKLKLGDHLMFNLREEEISALKSGNFRNGDEDTNITKAAMDLESFHRRNPSGCRRFSYKELKCLSPKLSSENLIGKGGSNQVYKGYLPNGQPCAVKITRFSGETWRDFISEVDIITSLQHKNIISPIGIGVHENKLVFVSDFLPRGSLEENLQGEKGKFVLGWDKRFKVAVGVAEALNYLHSCCLRPVIHRDVKSSNILLSNNFEPLLSDFGLAIWGPTNSPHVTHSDVMGTFGYLAPEYFMYGRVSDKIDVYAFGVVLLELISGRKPISTDSPRGQGSLVIWAKPILESGKLAHLVDLNLTGKYNEKQLHRMALAATLCITRTARLRPQMSLILKLLQGEDEDVMNDFCHAASECKECNGVEDEEDDHHQNLQGFSIQSLLNLALLDVDDDDTTLESRTAKSARKSLDDYLRGRWSRSSSFN
ncbi:pto-interacting protein 1 [Amborella trichopoda]|uniref:Protein kinase domain-containing protein n=1 Tax=Amborella trichopoda TaxID=13333 RepID=W1PLC5_AMBTC|nr:pto-interacting protein 1 [Amborella trichopoda]ERN08481.1 hypothetical protein AMTR_s00152p00028220 [Amborella trichopoda]|eukprot:XP_006846900.1 pto-interacting protein 1 [Amborella trichopoda]